MLSFKHIYNVEVTTNMPNAVFAAWKAYAEENSEYN